MLQPHHSADDDVSRLIEAARFYDYRVASNPMSDGGVAPVPGARFPASLHEQGGTRIVPLDNSLALGCPGPATTPSLSASFLHVHSGDALATEANATSQLFYVMRGEGVSRVADASGTTIAWSAGDLFTLPGDACFGRGGRPLLGARRAAAGASRCDRHAAAVCSHALSPLGDSRGARRGAA